MENWPGQHSRSRLNLSKLNNDVLLIIIDNLVPLPTPIRTQDDGRPPTPLKNLSLVNRHFRALLRPTLLTYITLARPKVAGGVFDPRLNTSVPRVYPGLPNGWDIAHEAIQTLSNSAGILSNIKSLYLDLYGHVWENDYALATEISFIVTFLRRLHALERLRIHIPHPYMFAFEQGVTFVNQISPLLFENVTTLFVEYRMAFLLRHCPKVRHLSLHNTGDEFMHLYQVNFTDLIKSALHVKHVEAYLPNWSPAEIEHLGSAMPYLEYLHVAGYDGSRLSDLTHSIGDALKHLKVLVLPGIDRLSRDWHPRPSKYPYAALKDPKFRRTLEEGKRTGQNRAARLAFESITALEECWVGESAVARKCCSEEDTFAEADVGFNDDQDDEEDTRSDHEKWANLIATGETDGVKWKWTRSPPGFLLVRQDRLMEAN